MFIVYVQDLDEPDDLWSTTYQPTRKSAEVDEAEHGLGYTTFTREFRSLRVRQTVFVPMEHDAEVWLVSITNKSDQVKKLRLASYQELQLGGIGDWHREFHRLFTENQVIDGKLVAWKHPNLVENERNPLEDPIRVVSSWHGAKAKWLSDKQAWLGRCGTVSAPFGLSHEVAKSDTPRWDDPIAVGIVEIEVLPGQTIELTHVIAAGQDLEATLKTAEILDVAKAKSELAETKAYWLKRCAQNPVRSGDPAVDVMANTWLPYQAIAGRIYARCAYYQQGGAYGHRDQLQDSLLFLDLGEPENTLLQLRRHAGAMFEDGSVKHWWHPSIGWGVESHHSDTCLWLSYGTLAYLEGTGDVKALNEVLPYSPGKPSREINEPSVTKGSLLEHCLKGIERCLSLQSPRKLPLLGAGDWNDGLSHAGIEGKGESVWVAMFLFDILNRWKPFLQQVGLSELADRYQLEADSLKHAVNTYGWDGEWYIEGTRDDGRPLGGKSEPQGKIFLNPQTWAVLTGIAPEDRAKQAMAAAKEQLVKEYSALLLAPAFSVVNNYVGYITRYAPGLRENGGVYSHASTWAIMAFAKMGDLETAQAIFKGMLPPVRSAKDADLYAAEPYVMPGNIDGPDSPYEGRAGWTWYTGLASWMARVARWLYPTAK